MSYTPGPWECGRAINYHGFYVAPKDTLPTLAAVERCGGNTLSVRTHNFPGDLEANARLIAAAPELLEACKAAYEIVGESEITYERENEVIDLLWSAIAKAERRAT